MKNYFHHLSISPETHHRSKLQINSRPFINPPKKPTNLKILKPTWKKTLRKIGGMFRRPFLGEGHPFFSPNVFQFLPSFGSRFAEASIGGWIPKIQGDKLWSIRIQYPQLGEGNGGWVMVSDGGRCKVKLFVVFWGKYDFLKMKAINAIKMYMIHDHILLKCFYFGRCCTFRSWRKKGGQEGLAGPNNWNTPWELICSGSFVTMAFPTHGFRWQWLIRMHLRSDRRLSIDPSLDFRLIKSLSMTESSKRKVGKMILGFLSRKWLISTRNHGHFLACRQ